MTEESGSGPTNPSVVVLNGKKRSNSITVAALGGIVGLVITAIGFFGTYIFVTKAELTAHATELTTHKESATQTIHALETNQKLTDAAVKGLSSQVKDVKLEVRVTNRNLEKLLRRSRIVPASREAMRIEIEGDP